MPARKSPPLPTLRTTPVPWNPGEHVAIIGTTGTGKSYLMSRIVELRRYVAIFQTKADDIKYRGFKRVPDTKALDKLRVTDDSARLLVHPEFSKQYEVGRNLFRRVWSDGGWTIVIDELYYAHAILRLELFVNMLATQGRSKRISLVSGMQRPVHVTRFALTEMTHIFAFRLENRDAKTIADAAGDDFANVASRVPKFHFAHLHVPSRSVAVGTADRLDRVLTGTG